MCAGSVSDHCRAPGNYSSVHGSSDPSSGVAPISRERRLLDLARGRIGQVARIEALRPHVVETERRPGWLSLSFAAAADDAAIDRLIEVERGCCDFLRIEREHVDGMTRVRFASEDPAREPVLEAIAQLFAI